MPRPAAGRRRLLRRSSSLVLAAVAMTTACDQPPESGLNATSLPLTTEPPQRLFSERGGRSIEPVRPGTTSRTPAAVTAAATTIDARRSLFVTDADVVSQISLKQVLDQLVRQSGVPGLTALGLFQQLWDTQRPSPGLNAANPHCNDQVTNGAVTFNTYPFECRSAEGSQATTDPFSTSAGDNGYVTTALVNRFDLSPSNDADCGEYRIVFARKSGQSGGGRNFLIFEAVLPNPKPQEQSEGCRPVQRFWQNLATLPSDAARGAALRDFYLTGLPGFRPVIHLLNFGPEQPGRIRSNQFMQSNWQLREWRLEMRCTPTGCKLLAVPQTVKVNPAGLLFNPSSTHARAREFQDTFFPSAVGSLAIVDINRFHYDPPDQFNAGLSDAQNGFSDRYNDQFGTSPSLFRSNIQQRLDTLGVGLTPDQVVARATTQSCAGCHELSGGSDLGDGLVWPFNNLGFVMVSEFLEPGPDGDRFQISDALTNVFLPHRQNVMAAFLDTPAPSPAPFFGARVNFQLASAPVPGGYVADGGEVFATRSNGLTYGWDLDTTANARDRNNSASPDQRYDTLIFSQRAGFGQRWDLAVPNGPYVVRVVAGDPSAIDGVYRYNVEGVQVLAGTPTNTTKWFDDGRAIQVTDGRLTLTNGSGATNNRVSFIDVAPAVLFESFTSSLGTVSAVKGGTWSLSGGSLQLTNPASSTAPLDANLAVSSREIVGDFSLVVEGRAAQTSNTFNDFSVVFGFVDAQNHYYASFNESNDPDTNGIFKVEAGVKKQLLDFSALTTPGVTHRVRIEREGALIRVFRDGVKMGEIGDGKFLRGRVGVGSRNDACTFDNLAVAQAL